MALCLVVLAVFFFLVSLLLGSCSVKGFSLGRYGEVLGRVRLRAHFV